MTEVQAANLAGALMAATLLVGYLLVRCNRVGRFLHPNGGDLTAPAAAWYGYVQLRRAARERRAAKRLHRQRERLTLRDVREQHRHRGWDD